MSCVAISASNTDSVNFFAPTLMGGTGPAWLEQPTNNTTTNQTIFPRQWSCSLPSCGGGLGWGVAASFGERATPHPNPPPQGGREPERCGEKFVKWFTEFVAPAVPARTWSQIRRPGASKGRP